MTEAERQRRQKFAKAAVTHGQCKTPEYHAWQSMHQRCENPKHPCFGLYGARGMKVCLRWRRFENFFADMGRKPGARHCLERLDNEQGYSPDNCAWKTQLEQMRNTRLTIRVTINGVTRCLKDWCVILRKDYRTAVSRIRRNWTPERALLEPVQTQYRKKKYGY
jgi:hypothetical protein